MKFLTFLCSALLIGTMVANAQEPENVQEPDSVKAKEISNLLNQRIVPTHVESGRALQECLVVDTLATENDAVSVVLYSDNSWRYVRNRKLEQDSTVFSRYWQTDVISPYKEVQLTDLPKAVLIDVVDSLHNYHYPYIGRMTSKYGPRRRRNHNGVDIALKMGDTIYSVFDGKVRWASGVNTGGYGNLVIIRYDNGLESYMGHMSKILVEPDQWVAAGQPVGLGGNTGRSTGPHLHFEFRYCGQSFDPTRLINFTTGQLWNETFILKRSYFSIYSKAPQNFDDEIANEEEDKKEAAEAAAKRYHKVRKGENLGSIARRNGTTVKALCRLNGIKSTTILKVGRVLRVR